MIEKFASQAIRTGDKDVKSVLIHEICGTSPVGDLARQATKVLDKDEAIE